MVIDRVSAEIAGLNIASLDSERQIRSGGHCGTGHYRLDNEGMDIDGRIVPVTG